LNSYYIRICRFLGICIASSSLQPVSSYRPSTRTRRRIQMYDDPGVKRSLPPLDHCRDDFLPKRILPLPFFPSQSFISETPGRQSRTRLTFSAVHPVFADSFQGTTTTPILPACAITLLTNPSSPKPFSLSSCCLIFAISYTCFRLTLPTVPTLLIPAKSPFPPAFPFAAVAAATAFPESSSLPVPAAEARDVSVFGPAVLPAPRSLFFVGETPAAARRRVAVGGVRRVNVKDRSGRTTTSAGMGVPGL